MLAKTQARNCERSAVRTTVTIAPGEKMRKRCQPGEPHAARQQVLAREQADQAIARRHHRDRHHHANGEKAEQGDAEEALLPGAVPRDDVAAAAEAAQDGVDAVEETLRGGSGVFHLRVLRQVRSNGHLRLDRERHGLTAAQLWAVQTFVWVPREALRAWFLRDGGTRDAVHHDPGDPCTLAREPVEVRAKDEEVHGELVLEERAAMTCPQCSKAVPRYDAALARMAAPRHAPAPDVVARGRAAGRVRGARRAAGAGALGGAGGRGSRPRSSVW
jgi:hypothetical protein